MTWLIALVPILMVVCGIKRAGGYRAAVQAYRVRNLARGGHVGFCRPWVTALTDCNAALNDFVAQMDQFARAIQHDKEATDGTQ